MRFESATTSYAPDKEGTAFVVVMVDSGGKRWEGGAMLQHGDGRLEIASQLRRVADMVENIRAVGEP